MLLWLGQNRAEKAVDDLFDGVTIGSSGIRATKSHNHNSTSSSSSSSCSVSEQTSLVNDTISNTISNDLSSNTVSNYTNNNKKSRAIFGDDLLTIDGVRFETNSATTTATTTTVVDPMYPSTVVKIKRENDTMPSSRSHLSQSGTITMPLMTSTNIDTMGQSTTTTTPITNGLNGVQAQQQQQQPIARKRTAYQAALAGVTVVASSTSTNLSNVTNSGLLSDGLPEVSSSQNCTGISPVPSLESSEIDLELWDLDIHESSTSQSSGIEFDFIYFILIINNKNINNKNKKNKTHYMRGHTCQPKQINNKQAICNTIQCNTIPKHRDRGRRRAKQYDPLVV